MVSPDKIKEVQKQLRSGVPEGEIKNELIKEGFNEDEIAGFFAPKKYDMRSWYLVFAIVFLVAGIYVATLGAGLWLIVFSAIMFSQYYNADKKMRQS